MTGCDEKEAVLYLCMDRSVVRYEDTFYIKDLGSMTCSDATILAQVKSRKLYRFRHPGNMVISVTKVIEEIHRIYPALEVVNLGETDVIMEYRRKKPKQAEQMVKTVLLCVLLFIGAGFAIMAFHNDISITEVFERFYLQVMGREKPKISVIEISYSIGLAAGILFFYNHFGNKKFTHDPTPMQVEMRKYEQDVDTTIIENSARRGENLDAS